MDAIYATHTVSVTQLKRNYANIIGSLNGESVAILNHNKPEAYLVPAAYYEHLMQLLERVEELEDAKILQERQDGPFVEIADLDAL